MQVQVELLHPDDLDAFAVFLTASAASRRKRPYGALWSGPLPTDEEESVTREAEDLTPDPAEADDKPKRTRRTKAQIEADNAANETVANLDPEVVATAEAAGVHVQGPAVSEDEPELPLSHGDIDADAADFHAEEDKQADTPAMTENDVRNAIIDLLNEAQAKFPDDADVRTKTLAPILKALGAEKISKIAESEYGRVPGILAKARADMDAALKEAA